jgi:hypothetical protein
MRSSLKLIAALALAATSLGIATTGAVAEEEDMDTFERCRTFNLQADRSRTLRFPFEDKEPGLVTVKANSTKYDLYVVDADNVPVCMSLEANEDEQSCVWVADGAQRYKARVVNVSATPGWDGLGSARNSEDENDEGDEEGQSIEATVCFVYEN